MNTNTIISSVIFIALLLSIATIPPINSLSVYQVKAEDQNSINELHRTQKSSTTSVAVNSLTNMIYSTTDSGVYVIDGKTNELIEKITIASNGAIPSGLAVNPMTNTIYVTDRDYNAVYVIDGKTHNVTKTIELHDSPIDIAINSVTNRIYVSAESALFVIDGVANEIIHRYKYIKIAKHLAGVAINPDKNIVYVTDSATSLYVLDGTTNQLTKNITIGKSPADIAVNTNTNKVYVVLGDSNRLSVVDGNTNSIVKTIVSGNTSSSSNSAAVSVNTNTNKVYVTDPGSDSISIIDGETNNVTSSISFGIEPIGIDVNTNTNKVYVANSDGDSISVIDGFVNGTTINNIDRLGPATTVDPLSGIKVDGTPTGIVVNPSTNRLYAVNTDGELFIIDSETYKIISKVSLGRSNSSSYLIDVDQATNKVFVLINSKPYGGRGAVSAMVSSPVPVTACRPVTDESILCHYVFAASCVSDFNFVCCCFLVLLVVLVIAAFFSFRIS